MLGQITDHRPDPAAEEIEAVSGQIQGLRGHFCNNTR